MRRPLVLIFDPDADSRSILVTFLAHHGFGALGAGSGEEAIELARVHKPNAVVGEFPWDVPGHSPLSSAIRREAGEDIPVIVLTSRAFPADLSAASAVADVVLTKPAPPSDVLEAIRGLLPGM